MFWKVGSPRTLATPDLIPFSKAFLPIADGFNEYSTKQYSFIQGTAVGLDPENKVLTLADEPTTITSRTPPPSNPQSTRTLSYSTLVLATGTTSASALWTLNGSHENTIHAMQELHKTLPTAKTVLIAGGGPAGVETTGEIAYLYRQAKTTILSGTTRLLSRLRPQQSEDAESHLHYLGADVIHNVRVTSATEVEGGKTTKVNLDDGSSRTVDIYIDATGGIPNSSFLPKAWLNDRGYVLVDSQTMRLDIPAERGGPDTQDIYAVGDVASYSQGGIFDVYDAIAPLCSSILIDLSSSRISTDKDAAKEVEEKNTSFWNSWIARTSAEPQQKIFKQTLNTQFVPIGPKGGVGLLFGWRVPSWFVWALKGRDYMIGMAPGLVKGVKFVKA